MVDLDGPPPAMPEKQFIKRDDIMFGYESRRQGMATIVPPNLVVAHGEEGAPAYYYYDIRNDLILRARNADHLSLSLKQLVRIAGYLMLSLKLDRQKMFNAALTDFLAGPAALQASEIGQTLKRVRAMASKPQPILPQPKALTARERVEKAEVQGQTRLGGGDRPPLRALLRDWITPSAWSTPDPLPIVESNPLLHARGQGAYLDVIPFTDTAYLRKRQAAAPFQFLHALWLIARLYCGRKRLLKAYKDGRTTP